MKYRLKTLLTVDQINVIASEYRKAQTKLSEARK